MRSPRHHGVLAVVVCSLLAFVPPAQAQATSPKSAFLAQTGWDLLTAGEPRAAAAAFLDAIVLEPRSSRLHLGAALAAYAERRDDDARALVERTLDLDPSDATARELLGRLEYRAGDLNAAILSFGALVGDGVATPGVIETLDRWRREADLRDHMSVAVGAGVTVAFQGEQDARLAQRAITALERAADRIGVRLAHRPTAPVGVVLYTGSQFSDITRSPAWAAGAFDGTIRIPVRGALARPVELDRVLAHEYTHALVFDLAKRAVPAWLNEGLAAALETEAPSAPRPAVALSLRSLERSFRALSDDDARQAYAWSAFAVRRLLDGAGGFAVMSLLRDLGNGEAFEIAFLRRIQRPFDDFEASLAYP